MQTATTPVIPSRPRGRPPHRPVADPPPFRQNDPLAIYLHDINATPLLSRAEERAVAQRVADGDLAARDHLIG
jgi:DNA-directed RNA polymerase sigma subunit (sigma70/sigma32)